MILYSDLTATLTDIAHTEELGLRDASRFYKLVGVIDNIVAEPIRLPESHWRVHVTAYIYGGAENQTLDWLLRQLH